ncbi:MAG: hypothetical protein AAGJ40_06465 [Planctomycetota bacterium]
MVRPPQVGIAVMLLMVIVFALVSAGLVYAARIPEVQEDWAMLWGTTADVDRSRRAPQILFIFFTVTSPLLLAMFMATLLAVWKAISKR